MRSAPIHPVSATKPTCLSKVRLWITFWSSREFEQPCHRPQAPSWSLSHPYAQIANFLMGESIKRNPWVWQLVRCRSASTTCMISSRPSKTSIADAPTEHRRVIVNVLIFKRSINVQVRGGHPCCLPESSHVQSPCLLCLP